MTGKHILKICGLGESCRNIVQKHREPEDTYQGLYSLVGQANGQTEQEAAPTLKPIIHVERSELVTCNQPEYANDVQRRNNNKKILKTQSP